MGGLSKRQIRKILEQEFPETNRETRQAIEIGFVHLVNRLPYVRLVPPLGDWLFADPELTTKCLVRLVCKDIQAGGDAPMYLLARPLNGGADGDTEWVEIKFREWPTKT